MNHRPNRCRRGPRAARLALCGLWLVAAPASTLAQVRSEVVARGFLAPIAVVSHPDHANVLLVAEQRGLVRVVRDGAILPDPFLDLRTSVSTGGERGLLGLVFDSAFAVTRRVFVNFTNRDGDTVIARFQVPDPTGLVANPDTRFDLMWPDGRRVIRQPFANHNGGHLAFGPDDYIYIGLGDGGSGGDPMHLAQNPQSLLGKMLRLDVSVRDEHERGYVVPADNPLLDGDPVQGLGEIWAIGLRNPWRFSFDDWRRGGTAALLIGDVGQNAREEINFEPSGRGGRNYGWRLREGRQAFDARLPAAFGPLVEPIHDYGRALGASITGGLVYRGDALDPWYHGRYFYADYISGRVFSLGLHVDASGEATADDEREMSAVLGGAPVLGMVSSFGADAQGEVLLVNYAAGTVLRIVPDLTVVPPAPRVSSAVDGVRVSLVWQPAVGGIGPTAYYVERVRGGAVVERRHQSRTDASMEWWPGDCLRVRAVGPSGLSGPPSPSLCHP